MIHSIKHPDGTVENINCKLGTGIRDKYSREIFEDDIVKVIGRDGTLYGCHTVVWKENEGMFWADNSFPLGNAAFAGHTIEIVGRHMIETVTPPTENGRS